MKIVVIGGTGLIGAKVVNKLRARGHEVVVGSPSSGINSVTGEGLTQAMHGASVVVDVANSPSFEAAAVLAFFQASGRNLQAAEVEAGVAHHVALSVVGTAGLPNNSYFRAKAAQEQLIRASPVPYTIVAATQFFEFIKAIAETSISGNVLRVPPVLFQPIAAEDVAEAVSDAALAPSLGATIEIAGPERLRLDEVVRRRLSAEGDAREVISDPAAHYFYAEVQEASLVPQGKARLGAISLDAWLSQSLPKK